MPLEHKSVLTDYSERVQHEDDISFLVVDLTDADESPGWYYGISETQDIEEGVELPVLGPFATQAEAERAAVEFIEDALQEHEKEDAFG